MSRQYLTLAKKEKIVSNAWAFTFERPEHFDFLPGQYIRIFDPVVGETVFRDFTIASSPLQKESLLVIIKEGASEYKNHLFSVELGEGLVVDAPLGRFYLDDEETTPLVFIAGGVGITPFYSMIQFAKEKLDIPMTLIASFSKREDVLFYDELKETEMNFKNLRIAYTLSQAEKPSLSWDFYTGRISERLIREYVADVSIPTFLISGSPSFVIDMEELLTSVGISSRQIRIEVFLGFN